METVAKQNNIDVKNLPLLDYQEHPLYIKEKMIIERMQKAKMLRDRDTSEHDVKYKTIEEARDRDSKGNHIYVKDKKIPLEELEKLYPLEKIEELSIEEEMKNNDSEDEKA